MNRANPLRGDVVLPLADGDFLLRPTFAALVVAEAEIGSLFGLLDRAGSGDIRIGEMGALLWHCRACDRMERERFEAAIVQAGPGKLLPAYRQLLTAIFGGI